MKRTHRHKHTHRSFSVMTLLKSYSFSSCERFVMGFCDLLAVCSCCTPCLAALFFLWVFWIDWFGQQAKREATNKRKKLKENCPTAPRPTVRADIFHLLNIRFGQGKWRNPLKDSQDNHRLCGWLNIGSTVSYIHNTRVFTVKYVITPHHHRHPLPLSSSYFA